MNTPVSLEYRLKTYKENLVRLYLAQSGAIKPMEHDSEDYVFNTSIKELEEKVKSIEVFLCLSEAEKFKISQEIKTNLRMD